MSIVFAFNLRFKADFFILILENFWYAGLTLNCSVKQTSIDNKIAGNAIVHAIKIIVTSTGLHMLAVIKNYPPDFAPGVLLKFTISAESCNQLTNTKIENCAYLCKLNIQGTLRYSQKESFRRRVHSASLLQFIFSIIDMALFTV